MLAMIAQGGTSQIFCRNVSNFQDPDTFHGDSTDFLDVYQTCNGFLRNFTAILRECNQVLQAKHPSRCLTKFLGM